MAAVEMRMEMDGVVARLKFSRPEKLNAFDRDMLREFGDQVRGVSGSDKVRVLVIEGEGKAFSAGGDLVTAVGSDSLSNYLGSLAKAFHSVLGYLAASPALVVTYANGGAVGGGFALLLAGDLRLAAPEAKFRVGYGRAGLTVDGGLSWRLPRIVGMAQAQRILFEDPDLNAQEAQALGIVHRIVPAAALPATLEEIVFSVQLQSRGAIQRNRELLLGNQGRVLAEAFEAEAVLIKTMAGTSDGQEGVRAFVAKRFPQFSS